MSSPFIERARTVPRGRVLLCHRMCVTAGSENGATAVWLFVRYTNPRRPRCGASRVRSRRRVGIAPVLAAFVVHPGAVNFIDSSPAEVYAVHGVCHLKFDGDRTLTTRRVAPREPPRPRRARHSALRAAPGTLRSDLDRIVFHREHRRDSRHTCRSGAQCAPRARSTAGHWGVGVRVVV